MWYIILAVVWLVGGVLGYMMMRQGFLVKFEYCLGKDIAWEPFHVILGFFSALFAGPLFMLIALLICGRDCCRHRQAHDQD